MGTVRGMCGRYVSVSSPTILAERFKVETVRIDKLEPRYNVTPRRDPSRRRKPGRASARPRALGVDPIVGQGHEDRRPNDQCPHENLTSSNRIKASVRQAALHHPRRRVLRVGEGSRPQAEAALVLPPGDGEPPALAGLWEVWHDPNEGDDAPRIRSCVIITTEPNDVVRPVHDRMPVVLPESVGSMARP